MERHLWFVHSTLIVRYANALLNKCGNIYSSRPQQTMVADVMGWDWLFLGMSYGPWWKRHRTMFQNHFHTNLSSVYQPRQIQETHMLLWNLLIKPDKFDYHVQRTASAIILHITYSYTVADKNDSYVTLADAAMHPLSQVGIFGTYLVDYIPILKHVPSWMPGASFKCQACAKGTAVSCVASHELEKWTKSDQSTDEEEVIKNIIAIAYAGQSLFIVSTIESFFLAMVLFPDVQKKAQDEIDCIVGGNQLPSFGDKLLLPYVSHIVLECLRAMFHDKHVYPEPFTFNPDCFKNQDTNKLAGINKLPHIAFGFVRRLCLGQWLAQDSIWIAVVSVLSVYNISAATDDKGFPIVPSVKYTEGQISHPNPFSCQIILRSEAATALIKQTADVQD
ncbi:hypothetical protein PILCRDRAFT_98545 [Piloderma croceum F 1598]|uniref:Cytochrome P450 n=1 Tax=Piloderma croceum (strain F 1598) TaxID=765440 RepID=A0A0C3FDA9_PILCF|nr:hypothetical protein PILCRDRAFT_98545 [Piloderma croceum F 1598]